MTGTYPKPVNILCHPERLVDGPSRHIPPRRISRTACRSTGWSGPGCPAPIYNLADG